MPNKVNLINFDAPAMTFGAIPSGTLFRFADKDQWRIRQSGKDHVNLNSGSTVKCVDAEREVITLEKGQALTLTGDTA